MNFAPVGLILSPNQVEVLTELGIDHTKLYFIDDDELPNAPSINAYSSGHYIVFSSDEEETEPLMLTFMKALYGVGEFELKAKFRDLYVYATPSAKFVSPTNLVTVTVTNP